MSMQGGGEGGTVDQDAFRLAREHVRKGCAFRFFARLYAERKTVLAFAVHFVCTMIIWVHFFLNRMEERAGLVPPDANRYWLKRLAPQIEYGSMHAVLFQMFLIPLTMSRLTISYAATHLPMVEKFVPLNRMFQFHTHLGYTLVLIVLLATLMFFTQFGMLCSDGEQRACDMFTSEIMITGYVIIAFLLIIAGTSYFRHGIKYEVFYVIHSLVFLVYALTILHTLDDKQRSGEEDRSQTFKWFSASILYYACDRASMAMNHTYSTTVASASAIHTQGTRGEEEGTKMVAIKVRRPALFRFRPGQYCQIRVPSVSKREWHPFSIASGPADSDYLEFYVLVHGEGSWTSRLWDLMSSVSEKAGEDSVRVELRGPYGTPLGRAAGSYSHALTIGSGTGVVPVLSLLSQHVTSCRRLEVDSYRKERDARDARRKARAQERRSNDMKLSESIRDYDDLSSSSSSSLGRIQRLADRAKRPVYFSVFSLLPPVAGVTMLGLTVSWNTLLFPLQKGMETFLLAGTVAFQFLFALLAILMHRRGRGGWTRPSFLTSLDAVFVVVSALADWYWSVKVGDGTWGHFSPGDMFNYFVLMLYMTLRLWYVALDDPVTGGKQSSSWKEVQDAEGCGCQSLPLDRMTFVWVTRSASLASKILPSIRKLRGDLVSAWGEEAANDTLSVAVYVTDNNDEACEALAAQDEEEAANDKIRIPIHFNRPDVHSIIEDHTIQVLNENNGEGAASSTLLAFCGSPRLAAHVHQAKIENDMSMIVTGSGGGAGGRHEVDFVSESYGNTKSYGGGEGKSGEGEEGLANRGGRKSKKAAHAVSKGTGDEESVATVKDTFTIDDVDVEM